MIPSATEDDEPRCDLCWGLPCECFDDDDDDYWETVDRAVDVARDEEVGL